MPSSSFGFLCNDPFRHEMFRPLICRPAPFPLVLGCSCPLVGVEIPSAFYSGSCLRSSDARVGYGTPTTPRLLHRRHFCLFACDLRAFLLSSLRVPRFPRRRSPNFATAGTFAAGNDFALLGGITTTVQTREVDTVLKSWPVRTSHYGFWLKATQQRGMRTAWGGLLSCICVPLQRSGAVRRNIEI